MKLRHFLLMALACLAAASLFTACPPTVNPDSTVAVESVSLDKATLSLTVGDTGQLSATVTPAGATEKSVTWTSSDEAVATVSGSGLVTAKAAGSATVTVKTTDGGKSASCAVTVSPAAPPVPLVKRTLGGTLSATLDGSTIALDDSCIVIARDATGKELATSGTMSSTAPWSLTVECPEGTEVLLYLSLWNKDGFYGTIFCDNTYRKTVTIGTDDMTDIDLGPLDFVTLSGSVTSVTHNGSPLKLDGATIDMMSDQSGTSSSKPGWIRTVKVNTDKSWSLAILPPIGTEYIYFYISMGPTYRDKPEYTGYCNESIPNDGKAHSGIGLSRAINDFTVSGSARTDPGVCTWLEGWVVAAYTRAPTGDESVFDLPEPIVDSKPDDNGNWSMKIPSAYEDKDLWLCLRRDAADGSAAAYFDTTARQLNGASGSISLSAPAMRSLQYCTISGTVSLGNVGIAGVTEYWIEALSKQDNAPDCLCYQNLTVNADGSGGATWSMQLPKKQSAYNVYFRVMPSSGDYDYVDMSPRLLGASNATGISLILSDMKDVASGGE